MNWLYYKSRQVESVLLNSKKECTYHFFYNKSVIAFKFSAKIICKSNKMYYGILMFETNVGSLSSPYLCMLSESSLGSLLFQHFISALWRYQSLHTMPPRKVSLIKAITLASPHNWGFLLDRSGRQMFLTALTVPWPALKISFSLKYSIWISLSGNNTLYKSIISAIVI